MEYEPEQNRLILKYGVDSRLIFNNVVGFSAITCGFWNPSGTVAILDFVYLPLEKSLLLQKLNKERERIIREYGEYSTGHFEKEKDFFETLTEFSSGDKLSVVCEYIEIETA